MHHMISLTSPVNQCLIMHWGIFHMQNGKKFDNWQECNLAKTEISSNDMGLLSKTVQYASDEENYLHN